MAVGNISLVGLQAYNTLGETMLSYWEVELMVVKFKEQKLQSQWLQFGDCNLKVVSLKSVNTFKENTRQFPAVFMATERDVFWLENWAISSRVFWQQILAYVLGKNADVYLCFIMHSCVW